MDSVRMFCGRLTRRSASPTFSWVEPTLRCDTRTHEGVSHVCLTTAPGCASRSQRVSRMGMNRPLCNGQPGMTVRALTTT